MRRPSKRAEDHGLTLSERLEILTEGNEHLASALASIVRGSRTRTSLKALAALDADAWCRVVAASGGAPAGTPGGTADERASTYARRVARVIALAFPTQVLAARMKADPPKSVAAAISYLAEHPEFQLGRTPDAFVRANPPMAGKATEVIAELKALQRVVSLSPSPEVVPILMKSGVHSASDILATTREDFVSEHPADDCLTVAEMTYERAQATLIAGEVGHDHGAKKRRS